MTTRGEAPGMPEDGLERALSAWRRERPPPPPARLRGAILASYDASRPRARRAPRLLAFAAAALCLACAYAGLLASSSRRTAPSGAAVPTAVETADVAWKLLELRLERLGREAGTLRARSSARALPALDREAAADAFARALGDERVLRHPEALPLITARALEMESRPLAASRYREILARYRDGPVAEVARRRLAELAR